MPLELLRCSICPRQQEFSDISHLLTHISSKGHLARWSTLNIKKTLDIAAGYQLASYNQWYHENGLEHLLSERMAVKDAKKNAKRLPNGAIKTSNVDVKDERLESHPLQSSPSRQVTRNRVKSKAKRAKLHERIPEDGSDVDYTPLQAPRRSRRIELYQITPVKRTPLPSSPPSGNEVLEIDPALVTPGPNTKLKGIIFPGMDLFDAAGPEEARRRNQKKDGSVVKNLERLSKLVEPTEAVYSVDGTLRKERHLDDLEDNSSLMEGETPVIKAKPRPRKKALAKTSTNVPRLVQTKAKAKRGRPTRCDTDQNGLPAVVRIPSSTTHPAEDLEPKWSPTEEENLEFQHAVRNMPLRKRVGNFAIFTDNTTAFSPRMASYSGQDMSLNQTYNAPMPQRLMMPSQTWLQPQNQNPLYMDNKYTYATFLPEFPELQGLGTSHENMMPTGNCVDSQLANPLAWNPQMPSSSVGGHPSDMTFGNAPGYFRATSNLPDPFGYPRNPLTDVFGHFEVAHDGGLMNSDGQFAEDTTSGSISQEQTAVPTTGE